MFGPQLKPSSSKDIKNHTHNNCTALYKTIYHRILGLIFLNLQEDFGIPETIQNQRILFFQGIILHKNFLGYLCISVYCRVE